MLSRCIAIDPQTFAREHWGRRPLLSGAGALPRDFSDLLSAEAVDELIAERGVRAPFIRLAKEGDVLARECYLGPAGFGAEMPDQVDSAKVLAEFASGATIVLQGLHRLWPPLIDFVRCMVDDLGHPAQANAYITPPSSRGFDPHYDVHDVFVLQASGRKHWTVHEPVHTDPLASQPWTDHRDAIAQRVTDESVIDTVLGPGDALYLPRGWVHSARALGALSIHLTIGVSATTGMDVLRAVVDQLENIAEFRKPLPMGIDPTDRHELMATATKIMAEMTETMREHAFAFSEDAATRLTQRHANRTRPVAVRPLASVQAAEDAAATTTVRWRHGLVATMEYCDERVLLRLPDRTMSFPQSCTDALAALHGGIAVDASGLPGLDTNDGGVLIRRLLREAVVTPAGQDQNAGPAHG
jgi:ribosomal protein L16 Arg81 hydroxylase